jgi:hypothetical protein
MKKSQKQMTPARKLRLAREVIAELAPRQLAHVAGGNDNDESSAPRCSTFAAPSA